MRVFILILLLALASTSFADIRLSKKLGAGVWRTADNKFVTLDMGAGETWYLYDQQWQTKNGKSFYKFWVPRMKGYLVLNADFLNFMPLNYSVPFE